MTLHEIRRIAVLGAGTMGTGLALIFAEAGYPVWLYSIPDPTLDRALGIIKSGLETLVAAGRLEGSRIPEIMGRIETTTDLESVAKGSDFIIEAVVEQLDVKKAVFEKLDSWCPQGVILASNTSYLNIFTVMPPRRLPDTAIAHFVAPAHIIPLVELVRGEKTSDATVNFLLEILKKAGRVPIVMEKYISGFCINRIQAAIGNEMYNLLDNGYMSPESLDIAVKSSIFPRAAVLGLAQRQDFTGLDLVMQNLQNKSYEYPPPNYSPDCIASKVKQGHLGVKTGKGFYDYSGRTMQEVLRARDIALLRVFDAVKEYMDTSV